MLDFILKILFWIWDFVTRAEAVKLELEFGPISEQKTGRIVHNQRTTMTKITENQQVVAEIKPKTSKGNPAKVDLTVPPVWEVSNPDVLEVLVDAENPLKATIKAKGPLGVSQVSCSVDADMDEGETRILTATGDVEVVAAEATTAGLDFGTPEEQPPTE